MATRHDRAELIQQDDGDPDETVFVTRSNNLGSRSRYHEDRDCREIHDDRERKGVERGWCHRRDYPPCKICVLGSDVTGKTDESEEGGEDGLKETCPLCGTEDVMLSSHLPKCDERNPPEGFDDE
jgi:hypothetical protein